MDNDDHVNIGDNEENNSDNNNNDVETTIMKYINDLCSGLCMLLMLSLGWIPDYRTRNNSWTDEGNQLTQFNQKYIISWNLNLINYIDNFFNLKHNFLGVAQFWFSDLKPVLREFGLVQDHYWDDSIPKEIPYTIAAEKFKKEEFQGSAERTLQIKDCDKVSPGLIQKFGVITWFFKTLLVLWTFGFNKWHASRNSLFSSIQIYLSLHCCSGVWIRVQQPKVRE